MSPAFLSYVDVRFEIDEAHNAIKIEAEARTTSQTGVEMEALMAAQTAAMTIYDMCKAVQKILSSAIAVLFTRPEARVVCFRPINCTGHKTKS